MLCIFQGFAVLHPETQTIKPCFVRPAAAVMRLFLYANYL